MGSHPHRPLHVLLRVLLQYEYSISQYCSCTRPTLERIANPRSTASALVQYAVDDPYPDASVV